MQRIIISGHLLVLQSGARFMTKKQNNYKVVEALSRKSAIITKWCIRYCKKSAIITKYAKFIAKKRNNYKAL